MEDFTLVDKRIGLCAKTNSGKSRLLKYLVECEKEKFEKIYVVCPTEDINSFYSNDKTGFVDKKCCFSVYDDEWLGKLMETMTKINANKSDKQKKHILLILDDVAADPESALHTSKRFKALCMRGRHIGIGLITTSQHLKSVPPCFRQNCDWFMLGQLNTAGIALACEEYCCCKMSKSEFQDMYDRATQNYYFLVCDNKSKSSNNIDDYYGKIKCPDWFVKKEHDIFAEDDDDEN